MCKDELEQTKTINKAKKEKDMLYKETEKKPGLAKFARLGTVIDMTTKAAKSSAKTGLASTERAKAIARRKSQNQAAMRSGAVKVSTKPSSVKQGLKDAEIDANHAANGITGLRSKFNKKFGPLGKAI